MLRQQHDSQNHTRTRPRAIMRGAFVIVLTAALTACCPSSTKPTGVKNHKSELPPGSWRFIVSGDSRNCGDVIMPAIAAHSAQFAPSFYWHLGDLRAIYKVDEDMAFAAAKRGQVLTCENYQRLAWSDFIDNQIAPFGSLPFYLGIGNHEVIPPKGPAEDAFKRQFADWLDLPVLQKQRQKDKDPAGPEPYYHWIQGGVDFIYLDNASNSFSPAQLLWLRQRLDDARNDPEIKGMVVGMHEALPDSIANSHSMGDKGDRSPGCVSGGEAYKLLENFHDQSRNPDGKPKAVYVLASHSHFYMENIFDTAKLTTPKGRQPLPGWIVGTAGAVRYQLPKDPPKEAKAKTDVYGYLVGTVSADSEEIDFSFQQVNESDVPQWVRQRYPDPLVPWCFAHNSQNRDPNGQELTENCLPPKPSTTPATGCSP
jgi:Calcineurin-like phosphoesterase